MGKRLGGRKEVLEAPAVEIFKFMDMVMEEEERIAEKEKMDWYMQFLVTNFAQLPQGEESAERRMEREKLLSTLQPKGQKREYKWGNPELDKAIAEIEQKGE